MSKSYYPRLVPGVGELGCAAPLDAGDDHALTQGPRMLEYGLEVLVSHDGYGNVIGVRNGGEIQHRGG